MAVLGLTKCPLKSCVQHPTAIKNRYPGRSVKIEQAYSDTSLKHSPRLRQLVARGPPEQKGYVCV